MFLNEKCSRLTDLRSGNRGRLQPLNGRGEPTGPLAGAFSIVLPAGYLPSKLLRHRSLGARIVLARLETGYLFREDVSESESLCRTDASVWLATALMTPLTLSASVPSLDDCRPASSLAVW